MRDRRRVRLSSAGEKYLESISRAFDEMDMATKRLVATSHADTVNISVAPALLTRWLVPRIRDFQERYPDIELRLSAGTGLIDFARSDIDMAIYFGAGDWDDVECHFLRSVVVVPVCSPGLLDTSAGLESPAEFLVKQTLIDVSSRPGEWDEFLVRTGLVHHQVFEQLLGHRIGIRRALDRELVVHADGRLFGIVRPLEHGLDVLDGIDFLRQTGWNPGQSRTGRVLHLMPELDGDSRMALLLVEVPDPSPGRGEPASAPS